jgi:hypothetical protein
VAEFDCAIDALYGVCAATLTNEVQVLGVRRAYR